MRKALLMAPAAAVAFVLAAFAPASAHQAGPCEPSEVDPGHSEYAQHHIVPLATTGGLGAGGHVPGDHRGFSSCD